MTDDDGGWGQPPRNGWGQPPHQPPYGQPPFGQPQYGQPPGPAMNPYAIAPHPQVWGQVPGVQGASNYKNVGILMLISGVKGLILSAVFILCFIWFCFGIFWFITLAGSVIEIVFGAMIMSGKPIRQARTYAIIGLVNGVLCGNIIGVALEAIALSQLARPEVEHYLAYAPER